MNSAIKRTKQLHQFVSMMFVTFLCTLQLFPIFPFFLESSERNLPKPLQGNSLQPQDFVLMKFQNYEARGQEHVFHNAWDEFEIKRAA